ncbi:MAG: TIM barrel protein [Candidatus Obscuribacterales bacterium]|nr:TIM barrel protein [Candidatus Obscuribacterales bacterium]
MRLCFDATRFGSGLLEAVQLAADKKLSACEFAFDKFDEQAKGAWQLGADEKDYLHSVLETAKQNDVEIACLKLRLLLKVSDKKSVKEFKSSLDKLAKVAAALDCKKILFYMAAEPQDGWLLQAEEALLPIVAAMKKKGIGLLLSLATPESFQGKSLRVWRPIEPQEWRDLLAGIPDLELSFSVADCAWQGIDYLRIISGLSKAIGHVEAQDVQLNRQIISENGVFGPLYWQYMTVGKGQVDWAQFIEALKLYEYDGCLSIQFNDDFASGDDQGLADALDGSIKVLAPLVKY